MDLSTKLCLLPFWQHDELPPRLQGLGGAFLHAVAVRLNEIQGLELVGGPQPVRIVRLLEGAKSKEAQVALLAETARKCGAAGVVGGSLEIGEQAIPACVFMFTSQTANCTEDNWPDLEASFFEAIQNLITRIGALLEIDLTDHRAPTRSVPAYLHFFRALSDYTGSPRSVWPGNAFWTNLLKAVAYDPSFREAADLIVLKSLAMLKTRMASEAEEILRQLQAIMPTHAGASFALAEFALARGERDSAICLMRHGLHHQPDFAEGYLRLALAYHHLGNLTEALRVLDELDGSHHDAANLHDLRGAILAQHGCLDDAILSWQKALSLDPSRAGVLSNLGLVMESKDPRLARAYYEGGLAIAPNWWGTYHNYGAFLLRQGDLGGAQRLLRRATELNRGNAVCLLQLGQVQIELGEFDKAEEALLKALQQADDSETRDQALAELERLNDHELQLERRIGRTARDMSRSRASIGTAFLLLRQSRNWRAWLAAGHGWEEHGWWRWAIIAYRLACRLDPTQAAVAKALGLLLTARGRSASARRFLQLAQTSWPGDHEIQRALRF